MCYRVLRGAGGSLQGTIHNSSFNSFSLSLVSLWMIGLSSPGTLDKVTFRSSMPLHTMYASWYFLGIPLGCLKFRTDHFSRDFIRGKNVNSQSSHAEGMARNNINLSLDFVLDYPHSIPSGYSISDLAMAFNFWQYESPRHPWTRSTFALHNRQSCIVMYTNIENILKLSYLCRQLLLFDAEPKLNLIPSLYALFTIFF